MSVQSLDRVSSPQTQMKQMTLMGSCPIALKVVLQRTLPLTRWHTSREAGKVINHWTCTFVPYVCRCVRVHACVRMCMRVCVCVCVCMCMCAYVCSVYMSACMLQCTWVRGGNQCYVAWTLKLKGWNAHRSKAMVSSTSTRILRGWTDMFVCVGCVIVCTQHSWALGTKHTVLCSQRETRLSSVASLPPEFRVPLRHVPKFLNQVGWLHVLQMSVQSLVDRVSSPPKPRWNRWVWWLWGVVP